jgi:Skp family chaperone for outer membrane proteins
MQRNLVLLAAALVLGTAFGTRALTQAPEVPVKLGFLDIKTAFAKYRKRQEIIDGLKKKSDEYDAVLKQRVAQIEADADKLATMNAGTDEYVDLARRIKGAKAMFEVDKEFKGRMLDAEQRKKNALVYKEISQEAAAYGQEHGLAAVLMYLPIETDFEQDLDMVVPTRAVLCRDDQLDVTAAVVDRLNQQLPPPAVDPKTPPK